MGLPSLASWAIFPKRELSRLPYFYYKVCQALPLLWKKIISLVLFVYFSSFLFLQHSKSLRLHFSPGQKLTVSSFFFFNVVASELSCFPFISSCQFPGHGWFLLFSTFPFPCSVRKVLPRWSFLPLFQIFFPAGSAPPLKSRAFLLF